MTTFEHSKNTKLSSKVLEILYKRGYSHIFNWEDYRFYREQTTTAIHRAEAIAELFIENTYELSDFADYEF